MTSRDGFIPIAEELDVVLVRKYVREVARAQGLPHAATEALVTAASEIAHNIVVHSGQGELHVEPSVDAGRRSVTVVARDTGPGIAELERALQDGYSTASGLGLGLSSARRLVDEFCIESAPERGTHIVMRKWLP